MTLDFSYSCHFSNMGWLQERCDGDIFWFPSHQIEAVKVQVKSDLLSCSVLNNAEGNWREADASGVAGTTGKRIPIFAIKLNIKEKYYGQYNVYYRVYIHTIGWTSWCHDGEICGNASGAGELYLQGMQIVLISKEDDQN